MSIRMRMPRPSSATSPGRWQNRASVSAALLKAGADDNKAAYRPLADDWERGLT